MARSAENEKPAAPKLSEIKPASQPDQKPAQQPEPETPAPAKKPNEKPALGHAFDSAAGTVENIKPIGTQTAALATLLVSLKKGEITPAAAFQSGQMTGAQALELLADTTIGTLQYRPLVHDLAEVVATKAPELIANVEKVAPQAKVRLAPYFLETRDPRAIPFYESILAAIPQPPSDQDALPVFKLSDYYAAIGDYRKAAETRLRMKDYTTKPQFLSNSEVEAARFYMQLGEEDKAHELYAGVAKHGYGWGTGMALYDEASQLILAGRHEEARKLLKTPITGLYADQMEIGMLTLLGYSYFQTEEFDEARKYSADAVARYDALEKPLQGENLEILVDAARRRLATMDEWKNKAFELPLKKPLATRDEGGVYHAKLYVHSFQKQPITVSFKNSAAQLVALTQESQKCTESGVLVTIYDLAYRIENHPASLEAQVASTNAPQAQVVELRYHSED